MAASSTPASPTVAGALAQSGLTGVDAQTLLEHALGVDAVYLIAHAGECLTAAQFALFSALSARRRAGEPVAYIIGRREFFSLEFEVTPAVLIPRPETELLVEFALEHTATGTERRVLDLGTGSGCVAISIARHRPQARVVAVERSAAALAIARDNAQRLLVDYLHDSCSAPPAKEGQVTDHANLRIIQSDWFGALDSRRFDLIVSNPPYVAAADPHLALGDLRFEPPTALAAGSDGLDYIRLIVASAPQYLTNGGWLAIEHGYNQAALVRDLLAEVGFVDLMMRTDLAKIARMSAGRWCGEP
jgi:release factor glutamine methyltransferase